MKPQDIYIPIVYGYGFFVIITYFINAISTQEHLHKVAKVAIVAGIFYLLSLLYHAKNLNRNLNTIPVPYDEKALEF
jgi:hypothetical protein